MAGFGRKKEQAQTKRLTINQLAGQKISKQATTYHMQGKIKDAERLYKQAIKIGFTSQSITFGLGDICRKTGRVNEATDWLLKTLEIDPNHPSNYTAHSILSTIYKDRGNLEQALSSILKSLQFNPDNANAHLILGAIYKDLGKLDQALSSTLNSLQLNPDNANAHFNLGLIYQDLGDLDLALSHTLRSLRLNPENANAHINLAGIFHELGNFNQALAHSLKSVELKPNLAEAHYNLGISFMNQGSLTAANISYTKSLELQPNHPEAHWNASISFFLSNNYKKGWEEYEWRMKNKEGASKLHAQPKCSLWDGSNLNPGEKILLVSEQGLGDTLQFMRYAIHLKRQGLNVSICAQPKLHSIIKSSGIDASPLKPGEGNEITEGKWTPLLSVPRHLNISPDNPIITKPYIKTTDALTSKWGKILSSQRKPIIAINWQGNPKTEKINLQGRSLPLRTFSSIIGNNQITLLSLQKGFGSEQLEACAFRERFVSCQKQVEDTWDFLETAAIIANCDLVLTSDTSVAHLAGGMGKTTWLLLQKLPDWRWGMEGETSFWYPSMRLFRQAERGNWDEVMQRVAIALQQKYPAVSSGHHANI